MAKIPAKWAAKMQKNLEDLLKMETSYEQGLKEQWDAYNAKCGKNIKRATGELEPTTSNVVPTNRANKTGTKSPTISLKNARVNFLKNVKAPATFSEMKLSQALNEIKTGKYKAIIEQVRKASSKAAYRSAKEKLPAYSFNGTFKDRVINDNFKESSGLFHFDIDELDAETIEKDKERIAAIPSCVFCFISPSGQGLKGALRVDPGWIKRDADFKRIYSQVEAEFSELGFKLDRNCKDIRRVCFVSHDPAIYTNYNAQIFPFDPDASEAADPAKVAKPRMNATAGDATTAAKAIARVTMMLDVPNGERHGARLRASRLAGGFVAGGWIDQDEMLDALMKASDQISDNSKTTRTEKNTIEEAFALGLEEPIELPDLDASDTANMDVISEMFEKMTSDDLAWTNPEVLDELLILQHDIRGFAELYKKLKTLGVSESKLKEALKKHGAKNKGAGAGQLMVTTSQYIVEDESFSYGGRDYEAGVYYTKFINGVKSLCRICSPLHVKAITVTENGKGFGMLLSFVDPKGKWHECAMPKGILSGSCEQLRLELLNAGVEIDYKNRDELPGYLQSVKPDSTIIAATRTGWTERGDTFVLHDKVIGNDNVFFQSETISGAGAASIGGDYLKWRSMAKLCERNPVFGFGICVALSGTLVEKVNGESGGVHFEGDSSTGKTTVLRAAASIWGNEKFMRSWRGTSNGIEGIAAALNDTCLCLDEIHQAPKKEVGEIVYTLGNGVGKSRANRAGDSRKSSSWRLSILSSGERPLSEMVEGQATAGQEMRLIDLRVQRKFGVLDSLEGFTDGRALIKHIKNQCAENYGHAGVKFIEAIINMGDADFPKMLNEYEQHFEAHDAQSSRVATRFALFAMAGELAVKAGILPWRKGSAVKMCVMFYKMWCQKRGTGNTEHNKILKNISDYIDTYGDTKFSYDMVSSYDDKTRSIDRAGWFKTASDCGRLFNGKKLKIAPDERIYFFTAAGFKAAIGDYSIERAIKTLEEEGWLVVRDKNQASKSLHVGGQKRRVYVIRRKIS